MLGLVKIPIHTAMGIAFGAMDTLLSLLSGVVSSADDAGMTALEGVRNQVKNLRRGIEDPLDVAK